MTEKVNHPSHYGHGLIEVAVAMDLLGDPWQWLGHALKYACRAPHKGQEEDDIRKAIWCARHAIACDPDVTWPRLRMQDRRVIAEALAAGVGSQPLRRFISAIVLAKPRALGTLSTDIEQACSALEEAYKKDI